jgi:hypothetical protein
VGLAPDLPALAKVLAANAMHVSALLTRRLRPTALVMVLRGVAASCPRQVPPKKIKIKQNKIK